MLPPQNAEPLRVRNFAEDARSLEPSAFRHKHAVAFLVYEGPEGEWESDDQEMNETAIHTLPKQLDARADWLREDYLVFPVRGWRTSPPQDGVTVGRLPNCDISIPHESLSKFHAQLEWSETDGMRLFDGSLRSATLVNGKPVPNQKRGDCTTLQTGDRLQFGEIALTFLDAADFQQRVVRACSDADPGPNAR